MSNPATPKVLEAYPALASWLHLNDDGVVAVQTGKVEIGQGVWTALARIVATELGTCLAKVKVAPVDTSTSPDEGVTAGSGSIEQSGAALRLAAATLRETLKAIAATKTGLSQSTIESRNGALYQFSGNQLFTFGELAHSIPEDLGVNTRAPFSISTETEPQGGRLDLPAKVTGEARYIQDFDLPGMVHGRVLRPPHEEATLQSLSQGLALRVSGLIAVIQDGSFVGVLAEREEQALQAVSRLETGAKWDLPSRQLAPANLYKYLRSLPRDSVLVDEIGKPGEILAEAEEVFNATYLKPYQAHGSVAPSCAVALSENNLLTVWTHSQGIYPLRRELCTMLSIDESNVRVVHIEGPGCYGHNGADDVAADAALLAMGLRGRPVRVRWSLEEELRWAPYGSAMITEMKGAVGREGKVSAWDFRVFTDTHSTRPNGEGGRLLAGRHLETNQPLAWPGPMKGGYRNARTLYQLPHQRIRAEFFDGPYRVSALRTLGAFSNTFANESFMDELAFAAQTDPLAFRLAHLEDSRAIAVLEAAAEAGGWSPHITPSGRGLGIALARYRGDKAYVAQVAEVQVNSDSGHIRVVRVVTACDAGRIVDQDGARNQLEGGTLQGISRTLFEQVPFDPAGPPIRNWDDYQVLGFDEIPKLELILIDRPEFSSLGLGEASTTPIAAAVANAVFDATGVRLRELPLTQEHLCLRLATISNKALESYRPRR
jgi:nicotinate dehydrogenase subunit B